jgi:hypothetical protein
MQSGELSFKQAGVMLLAIGIGEIAAEVVTKGHWTWGGIPVLYIGVLFAGLGVILTTVGVVKNA